MLSAAKHLYATQYRPFAEFTLSEANVLRVTGMLLFMSSIDQEKNYEVQKSLPGD